MAGEIQIVNPLTGEVYSPKLSPSQVLGSSGNNEEEETTPKKILLKNSITGETYYPEIAPVVTFYWGE